VNETSIALVRIVCALIFLTPVILYKKSLHNLKKSDWLGLMIVGLLFALHWWTYFYSIKASSASMGAIALSTYGIALIFLNWFFKKQSITLSNMIIVGLSFIGCLLVTPELNFSNQMTWGFTVGVISGVLYAALPLMHQRISHLPTMTRSWGQFAFAFLFFLSLWPQFEWPQGSGDWWPLITMGIVSTLIGHSLWVKASTELPTIVTSVAYYFYIPIAMVTSFIFLGENITPTMVVGACLIIGASLALVLLPWWKQRRLRRVNR
jgi:drug/metabolite transporter (DMT)-like permease